MLLWGVGTMVWLRMVEHVFGPSCEHPVFFKFPNPDAVALGGEALNPKP